jgi:hypothetical protein
MRKNEGHSLCFENERLRKRSPVAEWSDDMKSSEHPSDNEQNSTTSLETIIAIGLFGWLALSMTLMGLGIW